MGDKHGEGGHPSLGGDMLYSTKGGWKVEGVLSVGIERC